MMGEKELILAFTHSKDISADFVIRHLHKLKARYLRVDTDRLGTSDCFFGFDNGPTLHIGQATIHASEVHSIWARRFAIADQLSQINPDYVQFVKRELGVVLDAFIECSAALQINSYEADRLSGNRLIQRQRARTVGFSVPEMLVTQDAVTAENFARINTPVIIKALSYGLLSEAQDRVAYATPLKENATLDDVAACPVLLQRMIPNRFDWRVTTVGERVFSARRAFDKNSVDWRATPSASNEFELAPLPMEVSARLLTLCTLSGLRFGAHDFIETPSGEFVFLETNPAGQWAWLEVLLGMPIGEAIAIELINSVGPYGR